MKTIALAVFLQATAALAATIPDSEGWYLRRADEVNFEGLPIVDLEITDDRFEGVTFKGTVESVYEQMKELKPEIFANETDIEVEEDQPPRSLEARQSINCGWYNNPADRVGNWNWCIEGQSYLRRLDRAWCAVGAAPACARVSCSGTCGMFLCNKINAPFRVSCGDIPADIAAIANECGWVNGQVGGARDFSTHFIGLRKQSC
ncbi:hypothetical protein HJFPF1_13318 [Paramyrothecium foliicola]|nr:hypothetical protein HJFPF1_13318 [Paramyrothecium foliicola]